MLGSRTTGQPLADREAALPTGRRWLLALHLSCGVTASGWQLDLGLFLWATV